MIAMGLSAGEASIQVVHRGATLQLQASASTSPWLEPLYPIDLNLVSEIHRASFRPLSLLREGTLGSRVLWTSVNFEGRGKTLVSFRKPGGRLKRYRRRTKSTAFDPMGLLVAMREALRADKLDGTRWFFFDGARTRQVDVQIGRSELVEAPAGQFMCRKIVLHSTALPLHGKTGKLLRRQGKRRTFTAWVSDDTSLLPVRLSGPLGFGEATLELVRYKTQLQAPLLLSASSEPSPPAPEG